MSDTSEVTALAGTYRLLGRLWRREVNRPLLEQLRTGELSSAWREVGGIVPDGDEDEVLEQLAQDYCQLFLGPKGHLPPYQSVWTSGQFQDQTSTSMRQYLSLIADGRPWAGETMLDHLGIQLEAMGALAAEFAARQDGSAEQLTKLAELSGRFFRDHLTWPHRLFAVALTRASTAFYHSVIDVTRHFLQLEADRLSIDTDVFIAERTP